MGESSKQTFMHHPGEHWHEIPSASAGIDPRILQDALEAWRTRLGPGGLDESVMVRSGQVFHRGPGANRRHTIWSATKSFTGTLLGLLIADGRAGLDDRAAATEPLLAESHAEITLRQFATMTSGCARGRLLRHRPQSQYLPGHSRMGHGRRPHRHRPQSRQRPRRRAEWRSESIGARTLLTGR